MLIEKIAPKGGDTRDGKLRKLVLEAETPEQQEQLWRIAQGLQNGWPIIIHNPPDEPDPEFQWDALRGDNSNRMY